MTCIPLRSLCPPRETIFSQKPRAKPAKTAKAFTYQHHSAALQLPSLGQTFILPGARTAIALVFRFQVSDIRFPISGLHPSPVTLHFVPPATTRRPGRLPGRLPKAARRARRRGGRVSNIRLFPTSLSDVPDRPIFLEYVWPYFTIRYTVFL